MEGRSHRWAGEDEGIMVDTNQPKISRSPLRAVPDAEETVASRIRVLRRDAVEADERRPPDTRVVRRVTWDEV